MHEDVRAYYNKHVEDEDRRLDKHPFEIPLIMHFADRYLTPGDYIFDVACGTGRIANQLLDKGYFMGLNDISDKNVELVKKRLGTNRNILFIERADALESKNWGKDPWDSIFIFGPLYHLTSRERRLKVLKMAKENVKPGGYIFSSFMTRIGALVFGLKNNPEGIRFKEGAEKLWNTGSDDRFIEATEWFTNAWFTHPEEVNPLIEEAGLQPLHLAGTEGVFGERFELYHGLDEDLKKPWMDFVIDHCEDMHMVQNAKHLLSVSQKPA